MRRLNELIAFMDSNEKAIRMMDDARSRATDLGQIKLTSMIREQLDQRVDMINLAARFLPRP